MQTEDRDAKVQRFPCAQCGSEQRFDATTGLLKCEHCGAVRPVPAGSGFVLERDLRDGLQQAPRGLGTGDKTRKSKCQECGAQVVFADGQTAVQCSFCGSAKVLEQEENRNALRPESLLPFSVDKKDATACFEKWLRGLWFRPNSLQRLARLQKLGGVYVPYWTFDAHVDSSWTAEAGYEYTVDEEYTTTENGETVTRTRQVKKTRWESASGSRSDNFDDVLVCASRGLPPELVDRLETFSTSALTPYSPGYLAGWGAEEYAIELQPGFDTASARMEQVQRQRCDRDVPGDTHRDLSVHNTFSAVTFKHVLLPVWIAAYRYRDEVYRFLVNGQTGEVVGKAPWSWVKITLFALTLCAVAALIWYYFAVVRQQ